jgi:hypothetical protein
VTWLRMSGSYYHSEVRIDDGNEESSNNPTLNLCFNIRRSVIVVLLSFFKNTLG